MKVTFAYSGGSRDGQRDAGNSEVPLDLGVTPFFLTGGGQVGRRFWTATEYTLEQLQQPVGDGHRQGEVYEITERLESTETPDLLIRVRCVGYAQ